MVRVGIIGCGAITIHRHAPEYSTNKNVEIAGFYDLNNQRAVSMAEKYKGKVYESYEEMLNDPEIDAISVCNSNAYHATTTIAALNAGKHVLCEKPMATSLKDAEAMVKAARDNNKFLMVGHNQRLVGAHKRAKQLIKGGELGNVISFKTSFSHCGPEKWSVDGGLNTWFFNKTTSFLGVMGDLGIHKIDLIRWLIDDDIEKVMSYVATIDKKDAAGNPIEVSDNAMCIMKSTRGIIGSMNCSWTNYGDEDNSTIIYLTKGVIKIFGDNTYPVEVHFKNGEKAFYEVGKIQTNTEQTKSGVIDAFIECIVNNIPPEISGEEGLEALKIIFACMQSSKEGREIKIK